MKSRPYLKASAAAAVAVAAAAVWWLQSWRSHNESTQEESVSISRVADVPLKLERASIKDILQGERGKRNPTIVIAFWDMQGDPVFSDRVRLTLGVLKRWSGVFPKNANLGGCCLEGHSGFRTGFARDILDAEERKFGMRFICAGQYSELQVYKQSEDSLPSYEVAEFHAPDYVPGKMEYRVDVILREKAATSQKPTPPKVHLRGIAPPEVDGVKEFIVNYSLSGTSGATCVASASQAFDLSVARLGGQLQILSRNSNRVIAVVDKVENVAMGEVRAIEGAVEYHLKRSWSGRKEGIAIFKDEESGVFVGFCGFDDPEAVDTSLYIPPGEYWFEHVHTDPKTRKVVRSPRRRIAFGVKRTLDFPNF